MMQPEDKTQEIAERAERLQEIGSSILRAARDELYLGMRFLDVALSSFSYQMDGQIHGFGTDGRVMYFQPQMLGGLYRENRILVNRGYLHMVFHCIFRHFAWSGTESKKRADDGITIQERMRDLSCDIAVEHMIDGMNYRSIRFSRSLLREACYLCTLAVKLQNISGCKDKDILFGDSKFLNYIFLCGQMSVFTMNRDCIFRFYQRIDQLDFFLAGMSRNMDILENNLRTLHGKLIDNLGYRFLISRNRIGTENNSIIRFDHYFLMDV